MYIEIEKLINLAMLWNESYVTVPRMWKHFEGHQLTFDLKT